MRRRDFLGWAGALSATTFVGCRHEAEAKLADLPTPDTFAPLPTRALGKTGEQIPILGLGTGPAGMGLPDADAAALYHRALDLGVKLLDTAPMYQRAQAQLRPVMHERRTEAFLTTKSLTSTASEFLAETERNLKTMGVEQVDLAYLHCVGELDLDMVLSDKGSLAGLREAQRRGWTRYVGFTAHNRTATSIRMLKEAEFDVIMIPLNYVDRHTYGFESEVLPLAAEKGVGVLAMKVFGGAPRMNYKRPTKSSLAAHGNHDHGVALRYALNLPGVSGAVVGVFNFDELHQSRAWASEPTPLTADELADVDTRGAQMARVWREHFGPRA